jgi:hypothetical protein
MRKRKRPHFIFDPDASVETDWPASDDWQLKQPKLEPEPEPEDECGVQVEYEPRTGWSW